VYSEREPQTAALAEPATAARKFSQSPSSGRLATPWNVLQNVSQMQRACARLEQNNTHPRTLAAAVHITRRFCNTVAACAALLALSGPMWAAESWVIEGRVVAVADGDTITILDRDERQHKIRFNGIDAPEKKQPFGNRSRQNLAALIFDRNVRAECHKKDRYGREVCKILDGSRDVGLGQIRAGYAWWYRAYANEQAPEDRERYELAEQKAKASKVGLWRDANPRPPWEWRRKKKHQAPGN